MKKIPLMFVVFYLLCMLVYIFKFPIANMLEGYDSQIINLRSLTYVEYNNKPQFDY